MRPRRRELAGQLASVIIFAIIIFGGVQLLRVTLGTEHPVMVVVSQSMVPTLGVGDFIFVARIEDYDALTAAPRPTGEIIVFSRGGASEEYIVHRAVEKYLQGGQWWFITKGDNNPFRDSQPVPEERVIGRVVWRIPIMGYLPLFIRTMRGILFIVSIITVAVIIDRISPPREGIKVDGRFPWVILIPFLASPLILLSPYFAGSLSVGLEALSIAIWYLWCLTAPLSFRDEDLCTMLWLYHMILIVLPTACDISMRLTGITPNLWWYNRGGLLTMGWLLFWEASSFHPVYNLIISLLIPGCILFFSSMASRRRGLTPAVKASRWLRSITSNV
ncbi:MAG: signal peptidase I [Candidatus Bathyarchaeia archaeon]|nr:signal peptidase I [Candidatus Bathyarchaeota archaeon]